MKEKEIKSQVRDEIIHNALDGQESREPIGKRVFSENKQAVLIAMDLIARTNLEEVGEDDILERAMLLRLCFVGARVRRCVHSVTMIIFKIFRTRIRRSKRYPYLLSNILKVD